MRSKLSRTYLVATRRAIFLCLDSAPFFAAVDYPLSIFVLDIVMSTMTVCLMRQVYLDRFWPVVQALLEVVVLLVRKL